MGLDFWSKQSCDSLSSYYGIAQVVRFDALPERFVFETMPVIRFQCLLLVVVRLSLHLMNLNFCDKGPPFYLQVR